MRAKKLHAFEILSLFILTITISMVRCGFLANFLRGHKDETQ